MADKWSSEKRSEVMAKIRSTGNKSTELALMSVFRTERITGWRRRQPLPGKPDFVFRRERIAIFVDGCFWHACPKCYKRPKSSTEYWDEKRARNQLRDRQVSKELKSRGWRVVRIWEHELRNRIRLLKRIRRLFD